MVTFYNKTIIKTVFSGLLLACFSLPAAPSLRSFSYDAASVLPVYKDAQGQIWVLLAREAFGADKGTYDDFGGSRDANEAHPLVTATRELFEEINAETTLGMSLSQVRNYIDLPMGNTTNIIAYEKTFGRPTSMVTYITEFNPALIANVHRTFYRSVAQQTQFCYREKDKLAVIRLKDLARWIKSTPDVNNTKVLAHVHVKGGGVVQKPIHLRPIFVRKLQQFFRNDSYVPGKDPRIRFYKE